MTHRSITAEAVDVAGAIGRAIRGQPLPTGAARIATVASLQRTVLESTSNPPAEPGTPVH